jgi:hypothetical protein
MALYELKTYTLHVGKMAEAVKLYQEIGFPTLQKGGQDKKLVGYFQSDTGTINGACSSAKARRAAQPHGRERGKPIVSRVTP